MFSICVNHQGNQIELARTTHNQGEMKVDIVLLAPFLKSDSDDNGAIVAALVHVAGSLLVAEFDNQHSLLNDAARAKNQAEAFAAGFQKMTGQVLTPPEHGPASVFDPPGAGSATPCAKCGHATIAGQTCLNCELLAETQKEAEETKGNKPDGQ